VRCFYGYHWDKEVLDAIKEKFFVGIMGVPNATGIWQVAGIRNSGIFKIKLVEAKRCLLHLKREDLTKPKEQRSEPGGEHEKLVCTGVVILLRMVSPRATAAWPRTSAPLRRTAWRPSPNARSTTPRSRRAQVVAR
jgi:hypothetical protein